jgi:hypothetical protein
MRRQFTAIIGEAKGGRTNLNRKKIMEKFDLETLKYTLKRIGLLRLEYIDAIAEELLKAKWLRVNDGLSVHKILLAHDLNFKPNENDGFSFISIEKRVNFIEQRMSLEFKVTDWEFFDSAYIQNKIHKAANKLSSSLN